MVSGDDFVLVFDQTDHSLLVLPEDFALVAELHRGIVADIFLLDITVDADEIYDFLEANLLLAGQ